MQTFAGLPINRLRHRLNCENSAGFSAGFERTDIPSSDVAAWRSRECDRHAVDAATQGEEMDRFHPGLQGLLWPHVMPSPPIRRQRLPAFEGSKIDGGRAVRHKTLWINREDFDLDCLMPYQ